jgi:hypothetical protein
MSDWLRRLHTLIEDQDPCANSAISANSSLSAPIGTNGTGMIPPLDAEGVPCGGCPCCGRGEFWRWPKFHREFNPRGWRCWFCAPPPPDSGPCDFCGVPDRYSNPRGTASLAGDEATEADKGVRA